ncbi:MAG: protein translocase subunit SecD [Dehalococcoidales bacterium]|jgi:preprotein translocase subunit SecD|nr:protein translocase subunit SecD [Dehalococcoidales bacterium]
MPRKNTRVFILVLIVFILAALVVLPINGGILLGKGVRLGLDLQGGVHIVYRADFTTVEPGEEGNAIEGAMAILQNRINPLGVTEPLIQKQGNDRIVIELPGLDITDKEKESLSRVVMLEFGEMVTGNETARWENSAGSWKPAMAFIDGEEKTLTSRYFRENTFVRQADFGGLELIFDWDEEGSELSGIITERLIGQRLGIFEGDEALLGEDRRPIAPTVQATITDRGVITGLSPADATRLSNQLNAGRLPVPLEIIYDQTVSPTLGSDFVSRSVRAGFIGILIVMVFMVLYYRLSGLLASLALVFYGVLVVALFKLIPVTLTLAGLGGFVLSIGMAVDANVLIFERMKEELRAGRTLGAAIEAGFNRAWTAIRDGNVTTLIVCAILLWLGGSIVASAPVVAFAWSLAIGVGVSMLTAIVVTRTLLRLFVRTSLAQRTGLFSPHLGKKNV